MSTSIKKVLQKKVQAEHNERVNAAFSASNGDVLAAAKAMLVSQTTFRRWMKKAGIGGKPLARGTTHGLQAVVHALPKRGKIHRFILTSAQNNTKVHPRVWENILALAKYHDAKIFVGTFSYDVSSYGKMAVKAGKYKSSTEEKDLWFDDKLKDYIKDERIQLGKGLVWCGEMNILPTASDPLSGLETYSGRMSAVFPHAKIAMRSVAAVQGSGAKLNYTTGTVTKRNYIQKLAGLKAEFHHTYGGLIVEVDDAGVWKVRQLDAEDESGTIHDLDLKIEDGKVTEGHRVESITWGDIHATCVDPEVLILATRAPGNMLDTLRPKYQFIHDLIEGASVNHHDERKPIERFKASIRGLSVIQSEVKASADILSQYVRPETEMVIVNSNHDRWLDRWLDNYNPQIDDPRNAELYHDGSAARYRQARVGKDLNVLEYIIRHHTDFTAPARFLDLDESFLTCNKKIENGQHGDLGPNGSRGSAVSLSKVGRRSNIGHTHTAGIYDGLYVAGTSTKFRMGYNHGPSSWTHSHIITYPNGKRAIITMFQNAWRAE